MPRKVVVIVTVFNEQDTIASLIAALRKQTHRPAEVVIVDGGSTDETFICLKKISQTWKTLKVYQVPGNRSVGRNSAISHSKSPIIAITDAGCIPDSNWLEEITKPFSDSSVQVVSGYYRGLPENIFQKCLLPYVLVMPDQAVKQEFFPSTRSMAVRRELFNKSGGFNPLLNHNEDFAFAHSLKKSGLSFYFAYKAIVSWMPRKNLSQSAWMFLRFAIGDSQAGIFRPQVKNVFLRFLIFFYLVFLSRDIKIITWVWLLALIAYLGWSVIKNFKYVKDLRAIFWLPILQLTVDACVLFGSIMGFYLRT